MTEDEIEEEVKEAKQETGKYAEIAQKIIDDKLPTPPEITLLVKYVRDMIMTEKSIAKELESRVKDLPIYKNYLNKITGIGPILSAGLIAHLTPIDRFATISKLWAYAGLTTEYYKSECTKGHKFITTSPVAICPVRMKNGEVCGARIKQTEHIQGVPKREKGYVLFVNQNLRTLMYKIARSFEFQQEKKSYYRRLYVIQKERYLAKLEGTNEKGERGHARNMAFRYIEKRFLANLWIVWRTFEGLKVTEPYSIEILGHTGYEPPVVDDGELNLTMYEKIEQKNIYETKHLVNLYYDIQKIRIKAFNNIVAWVKANKDKIEK
jgi:hypothetical protein